VVNVQTQDLAQVVRDRTGGQGVDAWVECSGAPPAIRQGMNLTGKTGVVVLVGLVGPETIPAPWNEFLYKELDVVGCFSSPPSSWAKALAAESAEVPNLRKLVTHTIPLVDWQKGFAMMTTGEAVKILIDLEA
jgi:L-iditol 2-dehydrogenase